MLGTGTEAGERRPAIETAKEELNVSGIGN